jgi:hypothetical protein
VEHWRGVVGYEGLYQVSDLGRVRSLDRWVKRRTNNGGWWRQFIPGKVLKSESPRCVYLGVTLRKNGSTKWFRIHRLVLGAFVGPCPEGMEGRHLDDCPTNNRLDNLAWGTRRENMADTARHRMKTLKRVRRWACTARCSRGCWSSRARTAGVAPGLRAGRGLKQ